MGWHDLLVGIWNGVTAWIRLLLHAFSMPFPCLLHALGIWEEVPFSDVAQSGTWSAVGGLLGAGSPLLGARAQRQSFTCD